MIQVSSYFMTEARRCASLQMVSESVRKVDPKKEAPWWNTSADLLQVTATATATRLR